LGRRASQCCPSDGKREQGLLETLPNWARSVNARQIRVGRFDAFAVQRRRSPAVGALQKICDGRTVSLRSASGNASCSAPSAFGAFGCALSVGAESCNKGKTPSKSRELKSRKRTDRPKLAPFRGAGPITNAYSPWYLKTQNPYGLAKGRFRGLKTIRRDARADAFLYLRGRPRKSQPNPYSVRMYKSSRLSDYRCALNVWSEGSKFIASQTPGSQEKRPFVASDRVTAGPRGALSPPPRPEPPPRGCALPRRPAAALQVQPHSPAPLQRRDTTPGCDAAR